MRVLAFDSVSIVAGEGRRVLSVSDFLDLPIHERVRHILGRTVEFHSGGSAVQRAEALRSLREWEVTSGGR